MERQRPNTPPADVDRARRFCTTMLPRVSRTFALCIRTLHGELRDAVTQAYLFCRIADTLEDWPDLDRGDRVRWLSAYAGLFPLRDGWEARVRAWERGIAWPGRPEQPDVLLCQRSSDVFRAFSALPARLRHPVEDCVVEMASGMAAFAARRSTTGISEPETRDQLAVYCHTVAGTVGTMLCRLFAATSRHIGPTRLQRMLELAERFGLALQLVNIVQDAGTDARRGASFVPRDLAVRHGLPPGSFVAAPPAQRRAVMLDLVRDAVTALDAAAEFAQQIPRREPRIRMFCLLPMFLAVRTMGRIVEPGPDAAPRVKISRAEVRGACMDATAAAATNRLLRALYSRRSRPVLVRLAGSHSGSTSAGSVNADATAPDSAVRPMVQVPQQAQQASVASRGQQVPV